MDKHNQASLEQHFTGTLSFSAKPTSKPLDKEYKPVDKNYRGKKIQRHNRAHKSYYTPGFSPATFTIYPGQENKLNNFGFSSWEYDNKYRNKANAISLLPTHWFDYDEGELSMDRAADILRDKLPGTSFALIPSSSSLSYASKHKKDPTKAYKYRIILNTYNNAIYEDMDKARAVYKAEANLLEQVLGVTLDKTKLGPDAHSGHLMLDVTTDPVYDLFEHNANHSLIPSEDKGISAVTAPVLSSAALSQKREALAKMVTLLQSIGLQDPYDKDRVTSYPQSIVIPGDTLGEVDYKEYYQVVSKAVAAPVLSEDIDYGNVAKSPTAITLRESSYSSSIIHMSSIDFAVELEDGTIVTPQEIAVGCLNSPNSMFGVATSSPLKLQPENGEPYLIGTDEGATREHRFMWNYSRLRGLLTATEVGNSQDRANNQVSGGLKLRFDISFVDTITPPIDGTELAPGIWFKGGEVYRIISLSKSIAMEPVTNNILRVANAYSGCINPDNIKWAVENIFQMRVKKESGHYFFDPALPITIEGNMGDMEFDTLIDTLDTIDHPLIDFTSFSISQKDEESEADYKTRLDNMERDRTALLTRYLPLYFKSEIRAITKSHVVYGSKGISTSYSNGTLTINKPFQPLVEPNLLKPKADQLKEIREFYKSAGYNIKLIAMSVTASMYGMKMPDGYEYSFIYDSKIGGSGKTEVLSILLKIGATGEDDASEFMGNSLAGNNISDIAAYRISVLDEADSYPPKALTKFIRQATSHMGKSARKIHGTTESSRINFFWITTASGVSLYEPENINDQDIRRMLRIVGKDNLKWKEKKSRGLIPYNDEIMLAGLAWLLYDDLLYYENKWEIGSKMTLEETKYIIDNSANIESGYAVKQFTMDVLCIGLFESGTDLGAEYRAEMFKDTEDNLRIKSIDLLFNAVDDMHKPQVYKSVINAAKQEYKMYLGREESKQAYTDSMTKVRANWIIPTKEVLPGEELVSKEVWVKLTSMSETELVKLYTESCRVADVDWSELYVILKAYHYVVNKDNPPDKQLTNKQLTKSILGGL